MTTTRIISTQTLKVNITSSIDLSSDQSYFSAITRRRSQNSSMYDYQIQLYNLTSLKLKNLTYIYSTYSQQKHPCEILADGRTIAVATKYHVIFYDQKLNVKFKTLHNLIDIYDLSSSPDSKLVAVVGDNTVLIWDSITFKSINFPFPIPTARSCKFSPDNKYLGVSSTSFVTLFQIRPIGDTYQFNLIPQYKAQTQDQGPTRGFGTFNTFDFNPKNSLQVVIGFGNASPRLYNFQNGNKQFTRLSSQDQPAYMNNFKIVQFMPDGKRVFSSDHLSGVGVWPGQSSRTLAYKQNFILLDPRLYDGGKKVLGYLWQTIKVAQIQFACTGQTFSIRCPCPAGQFWKLSQQSCVSCTQGNTNICSCGSNQTFNADLARCVYNCQNVAHSIKNMRSDNKQTPCFCQRGYIWKNGQCIFDCGSIMFNAGNGQSAQSCLCITGFRWDKYANQCSCQLGSQLVRQNGNISCECLNNYKFDQNTKKCVPICALGIDQYGNCKCKQGYMFKIFQDISQINQLNTKQQNIKSNKTILSGTNGQCVRNCSAINYTLGLVGIDNCQCSENMVWMANQTLTGTGAGTGVGTGTGTGVGICKLDCSKIKNAIQYINYGNGTQACSCSKYYTWIPFNIQCGRNCNNVQYVNSTKHPTTLSCPCINNFEWNQNNKKCQINCQHIKFSQSYSIANSYSCTCRQIFQWHNSTKSCVVNCTEIWDANQRISIDQCTCKNSKVFNKTSMTCMAESAESAFSKPWVWAVVGIGVLFVIIVGVVMAKFCWKFSSDKNNKQHNKKLKKNAEPKVRKRKIKEPQEKIASSQRASLAKQ